jgi:uncharacterized membrane protein
MPMSEENPDHFEMRRLESLSNTVFGVAMTLLAYDLPKAAEFKSIPDWSEKSVPDWSDLYHVYGGRLSALVLSFIIAGLYWISHHRRLARQPYGTRGVVIVNLFFLLLIILLPVTNGLYSNYRLASAVSVLYGLHLTLIASLNALLWWFARDHGASRPELTRAIFPVLVFVPGTLVALVAPRYAQYVWYLAFGGFFVRRFADRRRKSQADARAS